MDLLGTAWAALTGLSYVKTVGTGLGAAKDIIYGTEEIADSEGIKSNTLEPMTVLFKIAALSYLPIKTRIEWGEFTITLLPPKRGTGFWRYINSESRLDLKVLPKVIKLGLKLFPPPVIVYPEKGEVAEEEEELAIQNAPELQKKEKEKEKNNEGEKEVSTVKEEEDDDLYEEVNIRQKKEEEAEEKLNSPLTRFWLYCITGIISQQKGYAYTTDTGLSLLEKPTESEIRKLSLQKSKAFKKWDECNKGNYDKNNFETARALFQSIWLIKRALLIDQKKPSKELSPIAIKLKASYKNDDFALFTQQLIHLRNARKDNVSKNPKYFKEPLKAIEHTCEGKINEYKKLRNELLLLNA